MLIVVAAAAAAVATAAAAVVVSRSVAAVYIYTAAVYIYTAATDRDTTVYIGACCGAFFHHGPAFCHQGDKTCSDACTFRHQRDGDKSRGHCTFLTWISIQDIYI